MFQHLWSPFADCRVEQRQVYVQIRIIVVRLHEHATNRDSDGQFLPALPDQRPFLCLSRFHLTAHKLTQQPPGLMGGTLANHKPVPVPNQRRYHFGYFFLHTARRPQHDCLFPLSVLFYMSIPQISRSGKYTLEVQRRGTRNHAGRGIPFTKS